MICGPKHVSVFHKAAYLRCVCVRQVTGLCEALYCFFIFYMLPFFFFLLAFSSFPFVPLFVYFLFSLFRF